MEIIQYTVKSNGCSLLQKTLSIEGIVTYHKKLCILPALSSNNLVFSQYHTKQKITDDCNNLGNNETLLLTSISKKSHLS
jgi:hypothetical protein